MTLFLVKLKTLPSKFNGYKEICTLFINRYSPFPFRPPNSIFKSFCSVFGHVLSIAAKFCCDCSFQCRFVKIISKFSKPANIFFFRIFNLKNHTFLLSYLSKCTAKFRHTSKKIGLITKKLFFSCFFYVPTLINNVHLGIPSILTSLFLCNDELYNPWCCFDSCGQFSSLKTNRTQR